MDIARAIASTRFVSAEGDLLAMVKREARGSLPHLHQGIEFYHVGGNASHEFSLGVKDGKLWKRSQSYDCWVDENGETHEEIEDNVYEVNDLSSVYLGSH